MSDRLYKFLFEPDGSRPAVRGEIVRLHDTWRQMLEHHDYPAPVRRVLGEMVAAAALLTANLKFNGALVMQIHGDGPVRLLVVECNADLTLRATAKLAPDVTIADDVGFQALVNGGGRGRFAITLDPKEKLPGQQPYQGIVPLEGASVSEVLEQYMLRSEQLDTRLWLAADDRHAAGVLLQRLPFEGGSGIVVTQEFGAEAAAETWNRTVILAETLKADEMLGTDPATLMRRLFWEETLRVFEPQPCSFQCSCSRARVGRMLMSLGRHEVDETLAEQGTVRVNCDFCNRAYEFDAVDCMQLFAAETLVEATRKPGDVRH